MSSTESSNDSAVGRASHWSIVFRLTLGYAASAFLLVAVASGLLYEVVVTNIDRENDEFLVDTVQIVRGLVRERPADISALRQEVEWEGAARRYARVYIRVLDQRGHVLIETPGAAEIFAGVAPRPAAADAEPGPGLSIRSGSGSHFRVLAAWASVGASGTDRQIVQVALDRTAEHDLLKTYRIGLLAVLGLTLLAATLVGYAIARRGFRPVEAITRTAREIRSSTLDKRIVTTGLPSELSSLAETFNQMMSGLEDAFDRLSSLSGDLAHELRTPINSLRGEVEVALGLPRSPERYREALESILEECVRLSRLIDALMFLARTDHPETQVLRISVDIGHELASVCEFFEPAAAEASVVLDSDKNLEPIIGMVDRSLFQQALSNLITNAITHTPAGGCIHLSAVVDASTLTIAVSDSGAGIPVEHLARVSDRFYRVDPSRSSSSGGLGLGLAIVKSIMRVHGGSMQITSEPSRGTTVRLIFPHAVLATSTSQVPQSRVIAHSTV